MDWGWVMRRLKFLLLCGTVAYGIVVLPMTVPAQAQIQGQSEPDLDKLDRMQRQMNLLQQQIQTLKSEIAQAKKKPAEPDRAYAASPPAPPKATLPPRRESVKDRLMNSVSPSALLVGEITEKVLAGKTDSVMPPVAPPARAA